MSTNHDILKLNLLTPSVNFEYRDHLNYGCDEEHPAEHQLNCDGCPEWIQQGDDTKDDHQHTDSWPDYGWVHGFSP